MLYVTHCACCAVLRCTVCHLQISTTNLERVRRVKTRMVRLTTRVETLREVLEKFLDDDSDMKDLNLTAKVRGLGVRAGGHAGGLRSCGFNASGIMHQVSCIRFQCMGVSCGLQPARILHAAGHPSIAAARTAACRRRSGWSCSIGTRAPARPLPLTLPCPTLALAGPRCAGAYGFVRSFCKPGARPLCTPGRRATALPACAGVCHRRTVAA